MPAPSIGAPTADSAGPARSTPAAPSADPEAASAAVARYVAGAGPIPAVTRHETHISWVFVCADRAFKLKKPVTLDFLDYGTPARRRAMCRREVEFNQRLAPDIYRRVLALTPAGRSGLTVVPESTPGAVDYLVEMRAFDPRRTLDAALAGASEAPSTSALRRTGARLAAFHRGCHPREVTGAAGVTRARATFAANLGELRAVSGEGLDRRLDEFERFLSAAVSRHRAALTARAREGHIREGHGDLRAEHVLLEPPGTIVDCLEFDDELRTLDTADDLAFLVMDLLHHGAEPAARAIVDGYRAAGGDCGEDSLLWLYATYRALVRAKVLLIRAGQIPTESPRAQRAEADALLATAARCRWRARGIPIIVLCGRPATGKSHLARDLADRWDLPWLNTDVVRKELVGIPAQQPAHASAYGDQLNVRTYAELGRRVRALLGQRPSVIVDGTFRHRRDQLAFTSTLGSNAPVLYVQCVVSPSVARERALARERVGNDASDATADLVAAERFVPDQLAELPADAHLMLRTDRDAAAIDRELAGLLDARL